VFFNGKKVGSVKTGESTTIVLPDMDGILQVGFPEADFRRGLSTGSDSQDFSGCAISSPGHRINAADAGKRFEIGTNMWVFLDVFSLCFIPYFGRKVFYIR
jgi:hypothetical protein